MTAAASATSWWLDPTPMAVLAAAVAWSCARALGGRRSHTRGLARLDRRLWEPVIVRRRRIRIVPVAAIGVIGCLAVGPIATFAVLVALATMRAWRSLRTKRSAVAEARRQLPDAVDVVVLGIRAGLTPAMAFAELAQSLPSELAGYFAEASLLHRHGERFADALTVLHAAPEGMLRPLATALARAERYGEPLAPVLDRLADEARRERRRQAETDARRLPVRMCFPLSCCTLPAFVLLTIVPLLAGTFTSIRGNLP